jgi:hypothetical protein
MQTEELAIAARGDDKNMLVLEFGRLLFDSDVYAMLQFHIFKEVVRLPLTVIWHRSLKTQIEHVTFTPVSVMSIVTLCRKCHTRRLRSAPVRLEGRR